MRHLSLLVLAALLAALPCRLRAQDAPKKTSGLFEATVKARPTFVDVQGRSPGLPRLPFGAKLVAAVLVQGQPFNWRRSIVDKAGNFAFKLPSNQLQPGSYQVLVRYNRQQQTRSLQALLKKLPPTFELKLPLVIGDALDAAKAARAEAELIIARLEALEAARAELDTLATGHAEDIGKKRYDVGAARAAYLKWLKALDEKTARPLTLYLRNHPIPYQPAWTAQVKNLVSKHASYARGKHRVELGRMKLAVPPRWQPESEIQADPSVVLAYLVRELPKLKQAATAERERLTKLAAKLEADREKAPEAE